MEMLEHIITSLDYMLSTKRKRHITGGILISASLLFSGFAITIMTINSEDDEANNEEVNFFEVD